ncbi:MAG: type II toxin-antitoxin system PemK/MazF family toxin [Candidatus Methanomethylophilaceae archaeon]|nr:type II toxin-antitoxin system PemK/MazF family toxin [Candidatus Methanomethylophilaceae archaeon]
MTDYLKQYKRGQGTGNNRGKGAPQPGEIWWVLNLDGIKDRPVLVLDHSGNMVTIRKCTSQTSTVRHRDLIEDYMEAGLDKETYADPEVRSIPRDRLARKLGRLSEYDLEKFGISKD